jgi:endonuclease/exonuclease/phosphatase family metal-dependent hydrolase
MSTLKFVLWNMEWMNDLFGPNDQPAAFRPDDARPAHHKSATVRQRRDDLSGVLNELAPDVVVVVEGPNRTEELQLFFDEDVQGEWKTQVQPSKGQSQNLGIAVRIDQGKFRETPFKYHDTNNIEAFGSFVADVDDDAIDEEYKFERRPLYVEIYPEDGKAFHVLGIHLKSKGIFSAYEWSKWWQVADANRRKLLAQATQLRLRFLDPYLSDAQTKDIPLIVCGDVNDGPGLDASEKRLFGSGIERLMGSMWKPDLCLGNALFDSLKEKDRANLNFGAIDTTRFKDPIFNDTWHNEWIDHILYSRCTDPVFVAQAQVHKKMSDERFIWEKYRHASDHYPISAVVTT